MSMMTMMTFFFFIGIIIIIKCSCMCYDCRLREKERNSECFGGFVEMITSLPRAQSSLVAPALTLEIHPSKRIAQGIPFSYLP